MKKLTSILLVIALFMGFPPRKIIAEEEEIVLFDNFTTSSPNFKNGPSKPTVFSTSQSYKIIGIGTVHFNDGKGSKNYGSISLKHEDGTVYGPWQSYAPPDVKGSEKIFWIVEPNVVIKPGKYEVVDSDKDTWSWTDESGGCGLALVAANKVKEQPPSGGPGGKAKTIVLTIGKPTMIVNGKSVEIEKGKNTGPIIIKGRTMLPIRSLIETLGGTIDWNSKEQKITLKLEEISIELWIGKNTARVSGHEITIDQPPVIVGGRTMVPLRFVSENLGCSIIWDAKAKTITIKFFGKLIPANGGSVGSDDGLASVAFPPHFASANTSASITMVSPPKDNFSGQYKVEVSAEKSGTFSVAIKASFKFNQKKDRVLAESLDEQTGQWVKCGDSLDYDPDTGVLYFNDNFGQSSKTITTFSTSGTMQAAPPQNARVYRAEHQQNWLDSGVNTVLPDSNFRITYFRAGRPCLGCLEDRVPDDSAWEIRGSGGQNNDPTTDNYIEDLDKALNEAYERLTEFDGDSLFQPLQTPFDVIVMDCGRGVQGETAIGGGTRRRMYISCNDLDDYENMKLVATHELIHVFQGQRYTNGRAGTNRWFVEAVATGLSAYITNVSEGAKRDYYTGGRSGFMDYENYLWTTFYSNNARSYYTCGLFVEWMLNVYGDSAITNIYSRAEELDLDRLSGFFSGAGTNLEDAFFTYCHNLMVNPLGGWGMNATIKANIVRGGTIKPNNKFSPQTKLVTFEGDVDVMSAQRVFLSTSAQITQTGLLVIDSSETKDGLRTISYDLVSSRSDDYANSGGPIDRYESTLPYRKTLSVMYFGSSSSSTRKGFDQMIINQGNRRRMHAKIQYYLLLEPIKTKFERGIVEWTTNELGNIPESYIKGYNIFLNGIKVSGKDPIKPVKGTISFKHSEILRNLDDRVQIQVVDKYGNTWPYIQESKQAKIKITDTKTDISSDTFTLYFTLSVENLPKGVTPTYVIHLEDAPKPLEFTTSRIQLNLQRVCPGNPFAEAEDYNIRIQAINSSTRQTIAEEKFKYTKCPIKVGNDAP